MRQVQCKAIEKPKMPFICELIRPASDMRYQDAEDGQYKPVQGEKWEKWMILAETEAGAHKIAEYHFHNSDILSVKAF